MNRQNTKLNAGGRRPVQSPNAFGPRLLVDTMRRWWPIALPVGLVAAVGAAALVWLTFVPVYESRSVIRIDRVDPYLIEPDAASNSEGFLQSELALIKSPMILRKVVELKDVMKVPEIREADDKEEQLGDMISVKSASGDLFHYVSVRARSGDDAKTICDAVVEKYFEDREWREEQDALQLVGLLDRELTASKKRVESLQNEIAQELKRQSEQSEVPQSVISDDKEGLVYTPLLELQKDYELKLIAHRVLLSDIADLQSEVDQGESSVTDDDVALAVESDGYVASLKVRIASEQSQLDQSNLGESHPDNKALLRSMAQAKQMLATAKERLTGELREQLEAAEKKERDDRLKGLKINESRLSHELSILQDSIASYKGQLLEAEQNSLKLDFLQADLADARAIVERFSERSLIFKIENKAPGRVRNWDTESGATLPRAAVELVPVKSMSLAGCAAFVLPFIVAVLWEARVRRVSHTEQVSEQAELPIVGEVAVLPTSRMTVGRMGAKRLDRQMRLFEESVDSFRTGLLLNRPSSDCQLIGVTSAVANEGKTTVASQLAMSIGRATGKRILLIDGDLRAPDIHRIFDVSGELGVCEVLRGEVDVDEVLAASWEDNLFVLPAGRLKGSSPHALVGGEEATSLMKRLRASFDFVICDTSPVLSSSESLQLLQLCDETLVSVMRDVSRLDQVKRLLGRLHQSGVNVAGSVISGIPQGRYASTYGVYEAEASV